MSSFDFRREANDQTEEIHAWGELCARKGLPLGDTPVEAPIAKVFTSAGVMNRKNMGSGQCSIDRSYTGQSTMFSNDPR